jgi:hypothetical protein
MGLCWPAKDNMVWPFGNIGAYPDRLTPLVRLAPPSPSSPLQCSWSSLRTPCWDPPYKFKFRCAAFTVERIDYVTWVLAFVTSTVMNGKTLWRELTAIARGVIGWQMTHLHNAVISLANLSLWRPILRIHTHYIHNNAICSNVGCWSKKVNGSVIVVASV